MPRLPRDLRIEGARSRFFFPLAALLLASLLLFLPFARFRR